MTRLSLSSLIALALVACVSDNELSPGADAKSAFDEGEDFEPVVEGEDTAEEPGDTGEVITPASYCDERHFAAEAVVQDAECDGGPTNPDWNLEVLWEVQIGSGTYSPLVVGQLDDDDGDGDVDDSDIPDIIGLDTSAVMHSIRGSDGTENWRRSIVNTVNTIAAIGDLDGDGWPDVLTDINYSMTAIDGRTGNTLWTGPSSSGKNKGSCGAVGMADLDGDGVAEGYLGSKIVNGATGALRGNGSEGDGMGIGNSYGHSVAADLDNDGVREVIVGNAAYDPDGNTIWENGGTDGTVAIADLDLDGSPEIVSVGNYGVITMDSEGREIWSFDIGGALASTPVIADVDGDGYPEAIIPTSAALFVIDRDGNELYTVTPTGSGSGRGGASAYDLNGDGAWEIVWAGPSSTMIIDGASGDILTEYTGTNTSCAGPVPIVDLDGDGHAEIVVVTSGGKITALRDTHGFTQARGVWHQSDYSLTNTEDSSQMPDDPEPNWLGENNFRAGGSVEIIPSLYPVIRDVCSDECEGGSAWVWYSVANNGYYNVTDRLELEFWGVSGTSATKLATSTWNGTVDPGMMTDSYFIELTGVPKPLDDIQVRITGVADAPYADCDESDDITYWNAPVCL